MMNDGSMVMETSVWFGPLMVVLVFGLIVATTVLIVKLLSGRARARDESLAILKERFASGDISEEEYEKKRVQLRG